MKIKKRLTEAQEFEILKIVIDKFLLAGVLLIVAGLVLLTLPTIDSRLPVLLFGGGVFILIIFLWMIVQHYEVIWK